MASAALRMPSVPPLSESEHAADATPSSMALFSGSFLGSLLKAGIVFAIVQFIDGSITGPRITGSSVGLHPVWVMLALAVGGYFFGFVGILLAMPAAVLVKLSLIRALKRYRASALYNEPEIETEL